MKKTILSYDESEFYEDEFEYRKENWEDYFDEMPTDEQIWESVYTTDLDFYFEDFSQNLFELLREKNEKGFWKIKGKNMGWRNLQGQKVAEITNWETLRDNVLPKTNEMTLKFYEHGKSLEMACYHHDSPCGETYILQPITEKTYLKQV